MAPCSDGRLREIAAAEEELNRAATSSAPVEALFPLSQVTCCCAPCSMCIGVAIYRPGRAEGDRERVPSRFIIQSPWVRLAREPMKAQQDDSSVRCRFIQLRSCLWQSQVETVSRTAPLQAQTRSCSVVLRRRARLRHRSRGERTGRRLAAWRAARAPRCCCRVTGSA